ncbi:unnamed protein product [Rhizoctonia solani]|uniref:T6SS Phospholipase effector Tle1-like catalytic domain-containing protein n=1 Tax=Rhizoctonia solani TaxID=456999 RepID=A0A8H3CUZ1_9AGAM|nr:unnamed protein product [Rhizoctonia solani]
MPSTQTNVSDTKTSATRNLVNTNVTTLYNYLKKDECQLTYYNSGIGTYARPTYRSLAYLKQVVYNKIDLAIAWNLEKVIIGAYRWLSDTYQPGDRIFLFGFSRGAYQVRALAGMIESVGLIHAGNQEQIPFAWELYAGISHDKPKSMEAIDAFKESFSRKVFVRFLGAWDTVSSIGLFRNNLFHLTNECYHITHFRHALALDERRVKFLPECMPEKGAQKPYDTEHTEKEVWFAGTHSDIGGGNATNQILSKGTESLIWMMNEAEEAGLYLHRTHHNIRALDAFTIKESLGWGWWVLEVCPPWWFSSHYGNTGWWPHWGKGRIVRNYQMLHWSVSPTSIIKNEAKKGYTPKASLFNKDGREILWNNSSEWSIQLEEDLKLTEARKLIMSLEDKSPTWFDSMFGYYLTYGQTNGAHSFWTYGGPQFIQKFATVEDEVNQKRAGVIARYIIGLKDCKAEDIEVIIMRLTALLLLCQYSKPNHGHRFVDRTGQQKPPTSHFRPNRVSKIKQDSDGSRSIGFTRTVVDIVLEFLSKVAYNTVKAISLLAERCQYSMGAKSLLDNGMMSYLLCILDTKFSGSLGDETVKEALGTLELLVQPCKFNHLNAKPTADPELLVSNLMINRLMDLANTYVEAINVLINLLSNEHPPTTLDIIDIDPQRIQEFLEGLDQRIQFLQDSDRGSDRAQDNADRAQALLRLINLLRNLGEWLTIQTCTYSLLDRVFHIKEKIPDDLTNEQATKLLRALGESPSPEALQSLLFLIDAKIAVVLLQVTIPVVQSNVSNNKAKLAALQAINVTVSILLQRPRSGSVQSALELYVKSLMPILTDLIDDQNQDNDGSIIVASWVLVTEIILGEREEDLQRLIGAEFLDQLVSKFLPLMFQIGVLYKKLGNEGVYREVKESMSKVAMRLFENREYAEKIVASNRSNPEVLEWMSLMG